MTSCNDYEGMIEAWLDDELGGEELEALRAHAAGCEACGASFAVAARLKSDMRSLAECADRIAGGKSGRTRIFGITETWKIAAAVLLAVGLLWSVKTWRGNVYEGPIQVAETPNVEEREVIRVADANEIVLSHSSHELAVQYETKRRDVKIVWLYTPVANPAGAAPTSSPSS